LSQEDLQARLAACGVPVSQPTLSHYETGKRAPGTMEEIVALAAALQVEPHGPRPARPPARRTRGV
jgi:transcriptional regulator with XRE-family HTH domain